MKHLRQYIRQILKEQMAQDIVPGAKVIFMAGAPGSGKSTTLNQLNLLDRFAIVNPDDWYEPFLEEAGIPLDIGGLTQEYFDLGRAIRYGEENGLDTSELEARKAEMRPVMSKNMKLFNKARKMAKEKQAELSQSGKDFIVDGTGGNIREITKLKDAYEGMGYSTAMVYISVPKETSVDRNFQRGEKGGRRLHQDQVERSWDAVDRNKSTYEDLFGESFFYIENIGTLQEYEENIELVRDGIQGFLSESIKLTKRQLRKIIRELNYLGKADKPNGIDAASAEYERGYQDAVDGFLPDRTAAADYEAGFDAGLGKSTPKNVTKFMGIMK
jgi:predicted ABC-type ATPase